MGEKSAEVTLKSARTKERNPLVPLYICLPRRVYRKQKRGRTAPKARGGKHRGEERKFVLHLNIHLPRGIFQKILWQTIPKGTVAEDSKRYCGRRFQEILGQKKIPIDTVAEGLPQTKDTAAEGLPQTNLECSRKEETSLVPLWTYLPIVITRKQCGRIAPKSTKWNAPAARKQTLFCDSTCNSCYSCNSPSKNTMWEKGAQKESWDAPADRGGISPVTLLHPPLLRRGFQNDL